MMKRLFLLCIASLVCLTGRAGFLTLTSVKGEKCEVELVSVNITRQTVLVRTRKKRQITADFSWFDEDSQKRIKHFAHGPEDTRDKPAAQWMSGQWGIGWRIRAGDNQWIRGFKVNRLVEQVKTIPGLSYVLFNLSDGANGSAYTAPHSVLSNVDPGSCSERDLFGELATAFQAAGYKVLVYMATEGPAKLKHGPNHGRGPESVGKWNAWVKKQYGKDDVDTLKKAYAEVIVREFAQRYGTKIDGWWFDHASFGNIELIHKEITRANPKTIVAFNSGKLGVTANSNPDYEDYTLGHPTPMRRAPANSKSNLRMVTDIEETKNGFCIKDGKSSLGHMFMPMKNRWNSGEDIVWPEAQAVEWMQRVLKAGGAWTWNVPFNDKTSQLDPVDVDFAKRCRFPASLIYRV
jgi:hypothetical protein